MNYLYAKLNKETENVRYKGENTNTVEMNVNNKTNTISANVKVDNALSNVSTRPVANKAIKSYVDNRVVAQSNGNYDELITGLKIGNTTYGLPCGDAVDFEENAVVINTPEDMDAREPHRVELVVESSTASDMVYGYHIKDVNTDKLLTPRQAMLMSPTPNLFICEDNLDYSASAPASASHSIVSTISGDMLNYDFSNHKWYEKRIAFLSYLFEDTQISMYSRQMGTDAWTTLAEQAITNETLLGEVDIPSGEGTPPREIALEPNEQLLVFPDYVTVIVDEEEYVVKLTSDYVHPNTYGHYQIGDVGMDIYGDKIIVNDNDAHTLSIKAQSSRFGTKDIYLRNYTVVGKCDVAFTGGNLSVNYYDAESLPQTITDAGMAFYRNGLNPYLQGLIKVTTVDGFDINCVSLVSEDGNAQIEVFSRGDNYKIFILRPVSDDVASLDLTLGYNS